MLVSAGDSSSSDSPQAAFHTAFLCQELPICQPIFVRVIAAHLPKVVSAACIVELTMSFWWFFGCCSAVEQVQLTEEECVLCALTNVPSCDAYIMYMLRLGTACRLHALSAQAQLGIRFDC